MSNEQALIAEIHNLPKGQQTGAIDAALRLIKNLAKQAAEEALEEGPRRRAGSAAGKYHIAPDFDEPLDDFKEYM